MSEDIQGMLSSLLDEKLGPIYMQLDNLSQQIDRIENELSDTKVSQRKTISEIQQLVDARLSYSVSGADLGAKRRSPHGNHLAQSPFFWE